MKIAASTAADSIRVAAVTCEGAEWLAPSLYVAGWYFAASVICFVTYGLDKSAARAAGRRVSESTLHLMSVIGGWPGAIVAQRAFRHKSRKRLFQTIFWITVTLNVGAFVAWYLLLLKHYRL